VHVQSGSCQPAGVGQGDKHTAVGAGLLGMPWVRSALPGGGRWDKWPPHVRSFPGIQTAKRRGIQNVSLEAGLGQGSLPGRRPTRRRLPVQPRQQQHSQHSTARRGAIWRRQERPVPARTHPVACDAVLLPTLHAGVLARARARGSGASPPSRQPSARPHHHATRTRLSCQSNHSW
jgi:hypothetical protein